MAIRAKKTNVVFTDAELHEMYESYCKDMNDKTYEEWFDYFFRRDTERFEVIDETKFTKVTYTYGMRLRGFSIGCQPMKGLLYNAEDPTGRYHDLLIYDRKLDEREMSDYELDYIGEGRSL